LFVTLLNREFTHTKAVKTIESLAIDALDAKFPTIRETAKEKAKGNAEEERNYVKNFLAERYDCELPFVGLLNGAYLTPILSECPENSIRTMGALDQSLKSLWRACPMYGSPSSLSSPLLSSPLLSTKILTNCQYSVFIACF